MAFDPDKYLASKSAPKFDPDAYLASKEMASQTGPSKGESALQGFGQAASFGYLPQLQAITEPITTKALDLVTGGDQYKDLPGYTQRRDAFIKEDIAKQEANPASYLGGQIGGIAASAPALSGLGKLAGIGKATKAIPGLGYLGPSTAQKLKQAIAGGAIVGGLSNPGDVEGEISTLQPIERLQNAAQGGAFGFLGQASGAVSQKALKAAQQAPKMIEKLGDKVPEISNKIVKTIKSAIGPRMSNATAGAVAGYLASGDIEGAIKGAAITTSLGVANKYGAPAVGKGVKLSGRGLGLISNPLLGASDKALGSLLNSPIVLGGGAGLLNKPDYKKESK